jgi:hypothetical protein
LLSSPPRVGGRHSSWRTGRLSSSLLLVCDRSYFVSVCFVFELGLAKSLFCYLVIMEPGSCEAYEKNTISLCCMWNAPHVPSLHVSYSLSVALWWQQFYTYFFHSLGLQAQSETTSFSFPHESDLRVYIELSRKKWSLLLCPIKQNATKK